MGSLQSAILGFGIFQVLRKYGWVSGFSIAENVIVQTCAVASATMPLAAGFVGVIPAMKHLTVEENPPDGPYSFSTLQLLLWSTTLAFFGVFVAVPLRTQVIEREQLRFPSGTATAQIIKTLHENHGSDDATGNAGTAISTASLLQTPSRVSYNSHVPFGFRIGSSRCSIERPYQRTTADVILSTALSAALDEETLSQVHIVIQNTFSSHSCFAVCLPVCGELRLAQPATPIRASHGSHAGSDTDLSWRSAGRRGV